METQTLPEHYQYGFRMASRYWRQYYDTFRDAGLDHDDLNQEVSIAILEMLKKYRKKKMSKKEINRKCGCAAYWRLNELLMSASRYNKKHVKFFVVDLDNTDDDNNQLLELLFPNHSEISQDRDLLFTELHTYLNDEEYRLLDLRVNQEHTMEELCRTLTPGRNYSKSSIAEKCTKLNQKLLRTLKRRYGFRPNIPPEKNSTEQNGPLVI